MADNLFSYDGARGELVDIFYDLLVTGKEVSYEDIGLILTPTFT